MKAKDLIKILEKNPEAEVVHYQYDGGGTPIMKINDYDSFNNGDADQWGEGGDFVKNKKMTTDVIILKHNPNKK